MGQALVVPRGHVHVNGLIRYIFPIWKVAREGRFLPDGGHVIVASWENNTSCWGHCKSDGVSMNSNVVL